MKRFRATLSRLNATANANRLEVERLQKVNDSLRLRLAALQLSWRCQMEVLAHRRRPWQEVPQARDQHDAPDELRELEAHLQELQTHISGTLTEISHCSGGGGGGGGGTRSPEGQPPSGGDGAPAAAGPSYAATASGGGEAGIHAATQEASLSDVVMAEAAAAHAGDALSTLDSVARGRGLPCHLPHLAVGRSVLHLSGATSGDVAQVCGLDVEGLRQVLLGFAPEARAAVARADAASAAADGAQALRAEADLERFGVRMQRCYNLMCIYSFRAYAGASMINWETGQSATGLEDAPMTHHEGVVRAGRLSRVQALLMIEMHAAYRKRLAPLHAERAALSELLGEPRLRAVSAASTPPLQSVGSNSMDAAPGGGGGGERAAAGGAENPSEGVSLGAGMVEGEQAEEQLWALEANIKKEQLVWQAFAHTCIALFSPQQWVRLWVAAFPYPLHAAKCCQVMEHFLKFEPDAFVE